MYEANDVRFDEFFRAVMDLWPRFNTTPEELLRGVWGNLHRRSDEAVKAALRAGRECDFNATKPPWTVICREAAGRTGRDQPHGAAEDFRIFIRNLRQHLRLRGRGREEGHLTDRDMFFGWAAAQGQVHTHDARGCHGGLPHRLMDDPDGVLESAAATRRKWEVQFWVNQFRDAGEEPPDFLLT